MQNRKKVLGFIGGLSALVATIALAAGYDQIQSGYLKIGNGSTATKQLEFNVGNTTNDPILTGDSSNNLNLSANSVRFLERPANGTNYISIAPPASMSGNTALVLPETAGTLGINPMSAAGQMVYGGASGLPTALSAPTTSGVLLLGGTSAPSYASGSGSITTPRIETTGTSNSAVLTLSNGNGTTAGGTSFINYINNKTSAVTWSAGLVTAGSDSFKIYDGTRTPIDISKTTGIVSIGQGLDFASLQGSPASGAAITTAQMLRFEEGTWTPVPKYGTLTTGTCVVGSNNGFGACNVSQGSTARYQVVGTWMTANYDTRFRKGSTATGAVTIAGLPYACASATAATIGYASFTTYSNYLKSYVSSTSFNFVSNASGADEATATETTFNNTLNDINMNGVIRCKL